MIRLVQVGTLTKRGRMATITGTDGDDTITGGEGADVLLGDGGNDWIEGGDEVVGGDTLEGGAGDDTLLGGAGNDMMTGGRGGDFVIGGAGDDYLYVLPAAGSDTLRGGGGNDVILVALRGNSGPEAVEVDGGNGDDEIRYAGSGDDSLLATGGAGHDTYRFESGDRSSGLIVTDFQAGSGGDRIDVNNLLWSTIYRGHGYEGGNPFAAEQGYLRLVQVGANTLLRYDEDGAAGTVYGWHTAAVLRDVDVRTLTAGNFLGIPPGGSPIAGDELTGTGIADVLQGWLGNDIIRGGFGDDWLDGMAGADLLEGGDGGDFLNGGLGDDTLGGEAGDDSLAGGYGDDSLHGGAGDDVLRTWGDGDDTLVGGAGADQFLLSLDSEIERPSVRVRGGDGNDFFLFEIDRDCSVLATGGSGRDTYLPDQGLVSLVPPTGIIVTDFEAGARGDRLDVSGLLKYSKWHGGFAGGNPFDTSSGYLRFVQIGTDTLLQHDVDGADGTAFGWQTVLRLKLVASSELMPDSNVIF
jgi:Ca2+-binding RTX toxin-like protein